MKRKYADKLDDKAIQYIYFATDGAKRMKEIILDDDLKKIPVIVLTTSSNQKDIDKAYSFHCNSYIQKPLEMEEFIKAVVQIEEFWLQLTTLSE